MPPCASCNSSQLCNSDNVKLCPIARVCPSRHVPARAHLGAQQGAVCSRVRLYPNRLLFRARAIPNFARRRSRQSIEPKAALEHRAPKTSPPILHSRNAESKVGRAVYCAPVWVVQTRLLGWNPAVRALTGAATARDTPGRKKPLPCSIHIEGTAAKMAARQTCPKAQRVGRARSPLRAGVLVMQTLPSPAGILPSAPLRAQLWGGDHPGRKKP